MAKETGLGEIAHTQKDKFDSKDNGEEFEHVTRAPLGQDNIGDGAVFSPVFLGESGQRASPAVKDNGQTVKYYDGHRGEQCPVIPAGNNTVNNVEQANCHKNKQHQVD